MSKEKLDRNREIRAKLKQGYSYAEVANEYRLSDTRIRQINSQVLHQELLKPLDVIEITEACKKLNVPKWMHGRIQKALQYRHLNVKNRWRKLTRQEILEFSNIGEKAADIIEYAQKL